MPDGHSLSLRKSLVFYVAAFAALALVLSVATAFLCDRTVNAIRGSYPTSAEMYYLTNMRGERLGEGTFISNEPVSFSERDARTMALLEMLPSVAAPLYSAACILAAALLFYRNKLRKPLAELRAATEKIAGNDLDFSVQYDRKDELGQLCASFEIMRSTLAKNFSEMWRQVEERKRLNAAFSHDLRTPLTVLKGYNEMLQADGSLQTAETAVTMGKHIARMEAYVDSMSRLRRLEDAVPEYETILLPPFLSALHQSMEILCKRNGKTLKSQNSIPVSRVTIDTDFVSQVCHNLIANAVRYARETITLSFTLCDHGLLLSVADDGTGFDKKILPEAASPYFTGETDRSEHFGLGLYICKLLCERHNGYLQIENTISGPNVTAFFKFPSL